MTKPELFFHSQESINRIAIIGGGIASLLLALELKSLQPSLSITLYCEDNAVGLQASGNQQGAIYPLLQGGKSNLSLFYSESFDFALPYYKYWLPKLNIEHQWCGVLQQAIKPELESRYKKVAETWPQWCEWLDKLASNQIAGVDFNYPSLFMPLAGWINPNQLCSQLATLVEQKGVAIKLSTSITKLEFDEKWVVGNQTYDQVVIANGHSMAKLLPEYRHYTQPVRGQVSQLGAKSSLSGIQTVICHKGYLTPATDTHQTFGATFVKDDENTEVRQIESIANIEQLKASYPDINAVSQINEHDIIKNKAGIRATTSDHIPICGQHFSKHWVAENVDKHSGKFKRNATQDYRQIGLYILSGLGARGLTSAPLLAKQLATMMLGEATQSKVNETILKMTAPNRFFVRELKRFKNDFKLD